jgi:hypothetical protein
VQIQFANERKMNKIIIIEQTTGVSITPNIPNSTSEDFKDQTSKHHLNKFEYDLYHEEDDIALPIIRVKHIGLPNKGERWKIFQDNKIILTVEGSKLSNKQKEFLRTVDGVNWLLSQAKLGINSFNSLKKELSAKLKK